MIQLRCVSRLGRCFAAAAGFGFMVCQSFAGYVYEMEQTEYKNGKAGAPTAVTMLVEGDSIKMSGMGKDRSEVIYLGKDQTLLMIDHKRKSYTQLDKAMIEEMANQLKGAMAQMEAQMASMPPGQREMMERMMKGKMPQASQALDLSVKRTGEKDTIAGYKAEKVELSTASGKQSELWVASWSDLEGSEAVAESFKGMSQLFEGMVSALSQGPMSGLVGGGMQSSWLNQVEELEGFPVKSVAFDGSGRVEMETVLKSVEERKLDATEFKSPKGYKRQKVGQ